MRGLIISSDRENAENIKIIIENMRSGIEMETKELQNIEYDILDAIVKKEAIERVFKALNSLETVYSEIIRYHVMGGFSLKDVADILKMNYGTVRCYYSKGMKLLRDIYYKLEEEDRFKIKWITGIYN